MRPSPQLAVILFLAASVAGDALAASAAAGQPPSVLPVNGLGVSLPPDLLADPGAAVLAALPENLHSPSPQAPIYVRVTLPAAALRRDQAVATLLARLAQDDLVPILTLVPPWSDPGAGRRTIPGFALDAWLADLDRFLSAHSDTPLLVEVGERLSERAEPRLHAFLLKRVSVRVKAVRPDAVVATSPISRAEDLAELGRLGVSPYVDAVTLDAGLPAEAMAVARRVLPGRAIWLDGVGEDTFLQTATLALARAVSLVVAAPGVSPDPDRLAAWRALLSPDAVVVPPAFGRVTAAAPDGEAYPDDTVVEVQNDGRGGRFVMLFGPAATAPVVLRVKGPRVGIAWLVDPVTREERIGGAAAPATGGSGSGQRVVVKPDARPALIRLSQVGSPRAPGVSEEVSTGRGLSLTEILARHRRFQAGQNRLFHALVASADIEYHFSVANLNQTFDVATHNRYFTDGSSSQYEEREMFINGARWRGARRPDLPFIVPEKVTDVPLDLRLDERYVYTLLGREDLDGHSTYVLKFEPGPGSDGKYRGKVWIDAQVFSRRRMEVIELLPGLPVISNEIVQTFTPFESGGRRWWLLGRLQGQMVFTALGRNILLEREIRYHDVQVNPPDIQAQIDEAWSSAHPIIDDSSGGFQRLEQTKEGGRQARDLRVADSSVSRLLVTGITVGSDFTPGIPFAGVNYFNMNHKGTGNQLDIIWAGPVFATLWSNPGLGNSRTILGVQSNLNPLSRNDRRIDETDAIADDLDAERVKISTQQLGAVLGRPIGSFHKLEVEANLEYMNFSDDDDTAPDFVIPDDTLVGSMALRWIYNRAGFRLDYTLTGAKRDRWGFWGKPDGSDFDVNDDHWVRRVFSFNKVFFVRRFDKLSLHFSHLEGTGLDRFSRFNFGQFGTSGVSGFGGSAIKFDRGNLAEVGYAINLSRGARLDVGLNHAILRNPDDFGSRAESATGMSLSLNFSGPWSTFLRARVGIGLNTTLEDVDPGVSARLLAFRTFDRWFWQKKRPPGASSPALPTGSVPRSPE
ncbi:MAG: hypothetical protein ACE5IK_04020 [Acidobacteriota bacterium]